MLFPFRNQIHIAPIMFISKQLSYMQYYWLSSDFFLQQVKEKMWFDLRKFGSLKQEEQSMFGVCKRKIDYTYYGFVMTNRHMNNYFITMKVIENMTEFNVMII